MHNLLGRVQLPAPQQMNFFEPIPGFVAFGISYFCNYPIIADLLDNSCPTINLYSQDLPSTQYPTQQIFTQSEFIGTTSQASASPSPEQLEIV